METPPQGVDGEAARALGAALAELEVTVGDREFVAELLGEFLLSLPAQIEALAAAQASGDRDELHRGAHTLKSNAATFGAEGLAAPCSELEGAARAAAPVALGDLVDRVRAEAARAVPGLESARDERLS